MIDLDSFSNSLKVQINILNEEKVERERIAHQSKALRVADNNGLTCLAENCFEKAEFLNARGTLYFCESHMLVKVAHRKAWEEALATATATITQIGVTA